MFYYVVGEIIFRLRAEVEVDYSAWRSRWVVESWAIKPKARARILGECKPIDGPGDGPCGNPRVAVLEYCERNTDVRLRALVDDGAVF